MRPHVELLDSMGDDLRVVNAARVSMRKETSEFREQDERLIHYLAEHNHWTPFSHVQITLRLKMPIFVARQWFKHQIGFTRNEVSRRYVDDDPEFFLPDQWRGRAPNVKQGSSDTPVDVETDDVERVYCIAGDLYRELLERGVCAEQARMILPQAMFTEFIETASLAAYARLVRQRTDSHAQREIREYATAVSRLIEPIAPVSWRALTEERDR